MTVGELKQKLNGFRDDTLVTVCTCHGQCEIFHEMKATEVNPEIISKAELKNNMMESTALEDMDPDTMYSGVCSIYAG